MAHLWTGAEITPEQIELELIRLYHCLPSQLRHENVNDLFAHLTILSAEAHVARIRAKQK